MAEKAKEVLAEKPKEVLVLRLIDRRESNYAKEGTEKGPNPVFLDAPNSKRVMNQSWIRGEDGTPKQIRYLASCGFLDFDRQEKEKYKRSAEFDTIWFKNGMLTVVNDGRAMALFQFLKTCSENRDAPDRLDDYAPVFYEVKTSAENEKMLSADSDRFKAQKLIYDLMKESADDKGFIYDKDKIDGLCVVFNVVSDPGDYAGKVQGLLAKAAADPVVFMNSIAEQKNSMRVNIGMAMEMGVLSLASGVATLVQSQKNIIELDSKKADKQIDELSFFFLSEEGAIFYTEMMIELEAAKKKAASNIE